MTFGIRGASSRILNDDRNLLRSGRRRSPLQWGRNSVFFIGGKTRVQFFARIERRTRELQTAAFKAARITQPTQRKAIVPSSRWECRLKPVRHAHY
jgi:hypothetical protein